MVEQQQLNLTLKGRDLGMGGQKRMMLVPATKGTAPKKPKPGLSATQTKVQADVPATAKGQQEVLPQGPSSPTPSEASTVAGADDLDQVMDAKAPGNGDDVGVQPCTAEEIEAAANSGS